ncbi:MAG: hypothetical protein ACI8ZO_001678 [Flavobacteriales bacterium]
MRILFLAEAINVDGTSAGLGSAKMIASLQSQGANVTCLHADFSRNDFPYLNAKLIRIRNKALSLHNLKHWLLKKLDTTFGLSFNKGYEARTGYSHKFWHDVNMYTQQIQALMETELFDLIFTRAKGSSFRMHAAMLKVQNTIPWVAYYHDPYPFSQYPEPYAYEVEGKSNMQEKLNVKIIEKADYVYSPSSRLLHWLANFNPQVLEKGGVIPHPGYDFGVKVELELDASLEGKFLCLHAGTLLGVRNPNALFSAWEVLQNENEAFAENARLMIVGTVEGHNLDYAAALGILINKNRVPYFESIALLKRADVSIILEPEAIDHPFFPGKLADNIHYGKTILALSSNNSGTREVLSEDHPHICNPMNATAIKSSLLSLFEDWNRGDLKATNAKVQIDSKSIFSKFEEIIASNKYNKVK